MEILAFALYFIAMLGIGLFFFFKSNKRKENEKKQKAMIQDLKQIQLSPVIDTHDIETKARHSIGFLKGGDKVKVVVRFKGRQIAHPELGCDVLLRFAEALADVDQ